MFLNKRRGFGPFLNSFEKRENPLDAATRKYFSQHVIFADLVKKKQPHANLKLKYARVFEICLASTIALMIVLFQLAREFGIEAAEVGNVDIKIEVADIPPTEQFHRPPPPPRPSVPLPTEDESVPDDLTIASTNIDLSELPPPPPPLEGDDDLPIFVAYDEPPGIVGGVRELQKYLKYPKLAANAGIEGVVFVNVLVGVNGKAEDFQIIKAKPANVGFEDSAVNALKKVRWKAAKQRDRKIRCWLSVPVKFQLTG
ncbi:MAG: TonB family protein [bacterium]